MQCGLLEKAVWVEAEPASLAMRRRIVRKSPRSKLKKDSRYCIVVRCAEGTGKNKEQDR